MLLCRVERVLLRRVGHPLVTSTTPDVSLKHTDTGGDDDDDDEDDDDDDKGVLEKESR